jgi:hypothetical protein
VLTKLQDDAEKPFEAIKIIGVIDEDVGQPRNDGTRGSALYEVPFRLSQMPTYEWAEIFVQSWDHPPSWTSMHRPGIAEVMGDRIILNGTTLEEVERYHRDTLKLALEETNKTYLQYLARERQKVEQEKQRREEHERSVREKAKRIKFD